jgi:hypothetical protein
MEHLGIGAQFIGNDTRENSDFGKMVIKLFKDVRGHCFCASFLRTLPCTGNMKTGSRSIQDGGRAVKTTFLRSSETILNACKMRDNPIKSVSGNLFR